MEAQARAMEWSVELEKGLRAKTSLRRSQAISDFVPKLIQWSRRGDSLSHSLSAHQLLDLIPGEDALFANAVLLRLAEAFRLGDLAIRVRVADVFLAEYRDRPKRKRERNCDNGGFSLLSKERVRNWSEVLKRVKSVFESGDGDGDGGDVESRSLALCLFGCWAGFAAQSSDIRYLVLSSMVSSHASQAKAAIFAAGCFCEASDDFPLVALEMLMNLMTSSETSPHVKLASARVYAKLGNSYSTAAKSHKTGLKIMLESSEEDFQVALLVSLSKIASKSTTLLSDQVHLLVSLLSQERNLRVRETALRCFLFIFSKGMCQLPVNADLVKLLFNMLHEPEIPTNMLCKALRILRKIILYTHPCPLCDSLDLGKLMTIAENTSISEYMSTCHLAIYALVDISKRCKVSRDSVSSLFSTAHQVVVLIVRQITSLVNSSIDQADSVKFQKIINNLFDLLHSVVQEDWDFTLLALDQIAILVKHLCSLNACRQDNADTDGGNSKDATMKILFNVYRFLVSFLERLNETNAIVKPVFDKVKLLVETVCEFKVTDRYIHTIYFALLQSPVIWGHNRNVTIEEKPHMSMHNHSVEQELIMLELTEKVLAENNYWVAYKVARYLACQGSWFSSSLVFQHILMKASSDSCRCWLNSLFHLASSGRKITTLMLDSTEATNFPLELLRRDLEEIGQNNIDAFDKLHSSKVVLSAYRSICFAKEALGHDLKSVRTFCFQRWFLSLRAKTFQAVVDVFETLETIPFLWENTSWQGDEFSVVDCLSILGQVSLMLKRLAKEFDLLSSSFIDMDRKSSEFISSLALAVSLLGFITSFSFFIPSMFENSHGPKNSKDTVFAHLLQNLTDRLWYIDPEISTKLSHLIDDDTEDVEINCARSNSRNHSFNAGSGAGDILIVIDYAVSEISCLRSKADKTESEENTSRAIQEGLRLTLKLLNLWMRIPFRTPNYFFRIRPCIGSELFAVSVNNNSEVICVSRGYHLPLSICLQVSNFPSNLTVQPVKLHCMLYSNPSQVQETDELSCSWESDDLVEMNEKLLNHMKNLASKNFNNRKSSINGSDGDCGFVSSFICCELNDSGQGFSSCLLDVSGFPLGSYNIKWLCCCVDNVGRYWNLLPLNAGPIFTVK